MEGENVLHHVKREGNCLGGENVRGDKSEGILQGKCPNPSVICLTTHAFRLSTMAYRSCYHGTYKTKVKLSTFCDRSATRQRNLHNAVESAILIRLLK